MPGLILKTICLFFVSGSYLMASEFDRPIPQPRSSEVELWFAIASLAFVVALYMVHRVISRR